MNEADVAVVRELFTAFDEGDLDRAVATVTDDFELVDIAADQTFRGPAGLRQWLEAFRRALPDARTQLVNVFGSGGWVATEHIGRGAHTGPFVTPAGTIPATGNTVELRIAELYEIRDGKIARLHAYYDSATMLRQLGLLPPHGGSGERAMTVAMGMGVKIRQAVTRRRANP